MKSPATRVFVQQLDQAINEISVESSGGRWIPGTKGQLCRKSEIITWGIHLSPVITQRASNAVQNFGGFFVANLKPLNKQSS